ncbi:hypothetical protein LAZ67_X001777 [Cordylochernes scorpioides]|uniref:Histone-lysine N-methyltransferase SETMAR n=1 Tax=Cordylochernes scorpioides TaxID=51811 RepID=A0ABY6LVD9_9ARAC|nr:hypothetical protein LAZ67_X001777 [Cordylochernes scorpioides]
MKIRQDNARPHMAYLTFAKIASTRFHVHSFENFTNKNLIKNIEQWNLGICALFCFTNLNLDVRTPRQPKTEAWGEDSSERTRWFQKFKVGDIGLEDQDGRGRRSTFKNVDLKSHIESNNTQTVRETRCKREGAEVITSFGELTAHLYTMVPEQDSRI